MKEETVFEVQGIVVKKFGKNKDGQWHAGLKSLSSTSIRFSV